MKYPNLVAAACFTPALSTMAGHANSTEKRIAKLLEGATKPHPFESVGLCRLYECTSGFLFHPELQVMRVDKFQHQQKIAAQLEKLKAAIQILGKEDVAYRRAAKVLEQGLKSDITYAAYLWASGWVRLAYISAMEKVRIDQIDAMEDPED